MRKILRERRRFISGFTLVELIVVMAIIAILAGIFLPMLVKAMRAGRRSRTAADLNAIALALEAYHADFGDYPRVSQPGTGFAVLGFSLIGPGPENGTALTAMGTTFAPGTVNVTGAGTTSVQLVAMKTTNTPPTAGTDWVNFGYYDGADGPGFRTINTTTANGTIKSKTYGPYLDASKFKMNGLAILDTDGFPIMYFPASPAKVNLALTTGYYVYTLTTTPPPAGSAGPMYNIEDNGTLACSMTANYQINSTIDYPTTLARMQVMMGDLDHNGRIGNGETAATTGPFLLWSVGGDGLFGPRQDVVQIGTDTTQLRKAISACDDVTNFTFAQ